MQNVKCTAQNYGVRFANEYIIVGYADTLILHFALCIKKSPVPKKSGRGFEKQNSAVPPALRKIISRRLKPLTVVSRSAHHGRSEVVFTIALLYRAFSRRPDSL